MAKNELETEITDEEFHEIINNSHKLVVVDFYADWCFPCLMLTPIVEELAGTMKEAKFVKINVDDNPRLSQKFKISNIPCLIIFKEGREVDRIIGAHNQEMIEKKIRGHL